MSKRNAALQIALFILALGLGLFAANVDARPNFDDTGILVFGLLFGTALLSLLGGQRPWLLALAAGLWIPLHDILYGGNWGALLALGIAFVGAYLGRAGNRMVRKAG